MSYLRNHGPCALAEISGALGIPKSAVQAPLKRLIEARTVFAEGQTRSRQYFLTDARDEQLATNGHRHTTGALEPLTPLKSRIVGAISRDPGELNEDRLAMALQVDREDVAVACGELLVDDQVVLNPDGTYTPARVRELAA